MGEIHHFDWPCLWLLMSRGHGRLCMSTRSVDLLVLPFTLICLSECGFAIQIQQWLFFSLYLNRLIL